ncbi:hypothetical protein EIKCOROL_02133 [Eikenella corrodens ATCC 23834]|uniref:Uncharacterized protein n=1 Tax=Eikenella corrodens ATCC 23834 TaxID=546274 RepID=C0DXM2_EIKCO|nr:hypothetical protein EIKCOROL_02133 [Eikenella corrodens ATCC 23834]
MLGIQTRYGFERGCRYFMAVYALNHSLNFQVACLNKKAT